MEYRKLGVSDLEISRIGFGCMSLEENNPKNENILQAALGGGINYYDTADIYQQGMNETILGRAFRSKRKQVILATKVGNRTRPDGTGLDWVPSKEYILKSVEGSLRRLQTDYIDLYQLHGGTIEDPIDEIIEGFELLKTSGKIRYYGISSIRPNVIRAYVKKSSIVSVMMQYSLLDRRPEEEMLPLLLQNQIGVLARGSIAKGLLVSKPAASYLDYTEEEVEKMSDTVHALAGENHTAFEMAVQFVLNQTAISSAIIGLRTEEQLKAAVRLEQLKSFETEQKDLLQNILPVNRYTEHR